MTGIATCTAKPGLLRLEGRDTGKKCTSECIHCGCSFCEKKSSHLVPTYFGIGRVPGLSSTMDAILRHKPCRVILGTTISRVRVVGLRPVEFGERRKGKELCAEFVTVWRYGGFFFSTWPRMVMHHHEARRPYPAALSSVRKVLGFKPSETRSQLMLRNWIPI